MQACNPPTSCSTSAPAKPCALLPAALLFAALLMVAPERAAAQAGPSLQELSIEWVRGRYGSPLLCQIEGEAVRGMRRMHVTPDSRQGRKPEVRLIFVSMEVENAERCFTDLEKNVPDITGSLRLQFPGPERRDSSNRDFKAILRREGGLEFDVTSGVLRLREVLQGSDEKRDVDFRGGTVRFLSIRPGTDAARMLSSIESARKLDLLATARDGTTLRFPLFLVEAR